MSLINQALKKAQHERTAPDGGETPGGPSQPVNLPPPPSGNGALVAVIGALVVLVVALAAAFLIFVARQGEAPEIQAGGAATPQAPATTLSAPALEPLAQTTPAPPGQPIEPVHTPPAQVPVTAPAPIPPQPLPQHSAQTAAPESAGPARAQPADALTEARAAARASIELPPASEGVAPDARIIEWLASAEVTGARVAGKQSRVLLNGEAYTIGETVSYTLGLRFVAIEAGRLFFEDGRGARYAKKF